jgi:SAM-dependent methyltransferase
MERDPPHPLAQPVTDASPLRLYHELASWWPLLSPPEEYEEEAAFFLDLLGAPGDTPPRARRTLLELGAGGGGLALHLKALHLKRAFDATLSDLSPEMVAISRAVNPDLPHVVGDMRSLRLAAPFDVVLIHDAIMYADTREAVRATLATAAHHCRPGGTVVVAPDCVRETFTPGTEHGGHDAPDGRGLRYLEWTWDPDPADDRTETLYTVVLREADGSARVELDRHVEGLFPRADWLSWLADAGLPARTVTDPWDREIFLATKARPGTFG